MLKKIAFAAALLAGVSVNAAAATPGFSLEGNEASVLVYGVVGTGGVGIGAGFQPLKDTVIRGEIAQFEKSYTSRETDMEFKGDLKLSTQALYADYHVFGGAFRVTAGVDFGGTKANLVGQPTNGAEYTIGGQTYILGDNDKVEASIKYPSTMPYLGIGWGLGDFSKPGFRFGFDLGANIGKPKASVKATGDITNDANFMNDLAEENRKLKDDAEKVKFFPVVKVSVGYAF